MLTTFTVPAALASQLGHILPLQLAEMAGLFFAGAPSMTWNIAKRGFDMQRAAGYQVWEGLLTPIVPAAGRVGRGPVAWADDLDPATGGPTADHGKSSPLLRSWNCAD